MFRKVPSKDSKVTVCHCVPLRFMPQNIDNRAVNSFAKQSLFMPFSTDRMMQDKDRQPNFLGRRAEASFAAHVRLRITIIKSPVQICSGTKSFLIIFEALRDRETVRFCGRDDMVIDAQASFASIASKHIEPSSRLGVSNMSHVDSQSSLKEVAMVISSKDVQRISRIGY